MTGLILFLAGLGAGTVNSIAGGGSLFTLPLLIFGSSTVGLWLGFGCYPGGKPTNPQRSCLGPPCPHLHNPSLCGSSDSDGLRNN